MRTNLGRFLLGSVLALGMAQVASAYTYILGDSTRQPVKWTGSNVVMHVNLGTTPTQADGNRNAAVVAAMTIWNGNLSATQFTPISGDNVGHGDGNHINEIFYDTTVYGQAFGDATVAVTTAWLYSDNQRGEADIVFNNNPTIIIGGTSYGLNWDSYRGNQQNTSTALTADIRRIALHELGHSLGLDHPDQAVPPQTVTAIMNSVAGNLDTLAADDITGAQHLYGGPGAARPVNDNFASATTINESDGRPYNGSNTYPNTATREGGEPQVNGSATGHSVWWKWVAPAASTVTIDTRGSAFDTMMGVYTGSSVGVLTTIVTNDDESGSLAHTSLVSFTPVAGTTYYIQVDGYYYNDATGGAYNVYGDTGDITLHLNQAAVNAPPTITNPSNTTVNTGTAAQFSVVIGGNPIPSVQWQRQPAAGGGFSNLSANSTYFGVTSTTLTINNTVTGMTGDQFRCVATNVVSSVTSSAATLTVVTPLPPQITQQPNDVTQFEAGNNAIFSVVATSGTTISYVWQIFPAGGSSWTALANGGIYSGVTTSALTITGVTYPLNGNSYRCVLTNTIGTTTSNAALLTVTRGDAIIGLSAGRYHSLRIDKSAILFGTGRNVEGQQGSNGASSNYPNVLGSFAGHPAASIAAGGTHSLFLANSNEAYATGNNANGQLGDGSVTTRFAPVLLSTNVAGIAASVFHSAYLKTDGTLWTVGLNDEGQLGTGDLVEIHTAAQIATNVVDLAIGNRQTLFVKADGSLWGAGDLYGNATLTSTPIQIATGVKTVAAGAYHSLILKTDGTLWTLGYNPFGQLGTGDIAERTTPVQIATNVKAIAAGYFHSAFIKTDGTLWVCGRNESGQLGDGSNSPRSTFFQLATNVTAVSASESYTLFLKTDGSLWGMGLDGNGQFGNYSTTTVSTPVYIRGGILTTPAAPTGLAAVANAAIDRLNLTWVPMGSAATYEIWRNTANSFGSATRIAQSVRWAFFQDLTASPYTTYYYWVTAVNPGGTSSPSTSATGLFGTPVAPTFITQPVPQTVVAGVSTNFVVAASGYPVPTLQWQRFALGGGAWVNLSNGGNYAGVTSTTLTVSGTVVGMSGDQFRCVATNSVTSTNSNAVSLTVTSSTPAVISDIDGDGKSDILWENTTTGDRGFWLMNGQTFSAWVDVGIISTDLRIAGTGDFNGDGKNDIVWENTSTGKRVIWFMNGTTFISSFNLGIVGPEWRIAAVADFNGDHKPDLLWENTTTGDRGFWIMNGTTFTAWVDIGIVTTDWRIATAGDFNGDGKPDILWENTTTGDRGFWLMNDTTFSAWFDIGIMPTDWRIAGSGDYNGDGKADILWENTVTGDRGFWLMNGTTFSAWVDIGIVTTDWRIAN